jgi:adhesin transport system outer membrane protein
MRTIALVHRGSPVRLRRLAMLLASAAPLLAGTPAWAATLADTIRAAIASNPDIGVVRADRLAVDQELRQARALFLPSVDLRAAAGPEYTDDATTRDNDRRSSGEETLLRREVQLKLSQMLWDGWEARSEVERQTARVNSASYRVEEAAEFVALNASEAHLDVLRNIELVRLAEANVAAHREILRQVRDLERGGTGDIADVRQTEARIAQTEAVLAEARGRLADARATYLRVVGQGADELVLDAAPVAALPGDGDAAADLASLQSPTVKIAASDVDVAAAELRGSRAGFYPRFDVELTGTAGKDIDGQEGNDVGASALLVLRYNLYRGSGDIAREREAFHRSNENRAKLEVARRKAAEEARFSWNALETARARVTALRARAEAQRLTRDAYAQQFEIGLRSLLDLLDAENELFVARTALVTAEFTERFAVYRVLAVTGTLLATLDIPPPREAVSIYRTPGDVQTPDAVRAKSVPLRDPRAEPRPLRGEEAGEPPAAAPDLSTILGGRS